ncbi:hypothetical protein [Psychrobacter sp. GP33]|uniref:hypothetical protein n=1 Tax=Psychrobacter sp. GP33 TaxID=2758709 RepID=UPI0015F8EC72|nr:hypothetical protein [Psychrobacter sp. GP33]
MGTRKTLVFLADTLFYVRWLIISIILFSVTSQAAPYNTYVIATYGGNALLPTVRQQLNASPDGGTVTTYQDKLVLNTTATNYQAVQQLLTRIDTQPQALVIAVRVGSNSNSQANIRQGQISITNRGIQGSGIINQSRNEQQSNSIYQVQTLSGSAASISTGTLWSLTHNSTPNYYPSTNRPSGQIIIQQQVLLPTTQGITVMPRLLPNGQVEVKLFQVEEKFVSSKSPYYQKNNVNNVIQGQRFQAQRLDTTIIVARGQWVTIGQITQNSQNQLSSYNNDSVMTGSTMTGNNSVPIQLLVQ